ncbi:peptidyl-prolyl cis-trans isomerase [Sphingomonas sp.]|uniref:peptidylprolyl isomerase n=1 Tax=Sphingomonas sp. TaxID=28214 RepID=UPI0035C83EF1
MLAFFRRFTNSRFGVVIAFAVLILIALGFGLGDIAGISSGTTSLGGASIAKVGGSAVGAADLRSSVQNAVEAGRRENPSLTIGDFVAEGGFDATLERLLNGLSLWEFGTDQGMRVGKKLVDGQLASFPSLRGPSGQFDQRIYEQLLRDQRLTDAQVRRDIAQDLMAQHLVSPTLGASQMPVGVAMPYANLLLERREGQVAFVPSSAVPQGAAPTDAEVQGWYRANIRRYSLPERRVIRYALVTPEQVRARATPSEAEIARAYAENRARYQPTEKRTITQVTVLTQQGANALAAKVRGGTSLAEAARAAGLEPRTITDVEKAAYAGQTSAATADAAFKAAQGGLVGPLRASLGYVVARVDAVTQVPGRTLAQAHDEIATTLTQQKTQEALSQIQDAIGGAIDGNATFAEIVGEQKLTAQATPAIAANGINPDTGARVDAALAQVVAAAFAATDGDAPTVVPAGPGGFAVVAVDRVVAPAPRPLAAIRAQVAQDFTANRARMAARKVANDILARAKAGDLAKAASASGLSLPPIRPLSAPRAALARNQNGVSPELAMLFSMAPGTAKLVPAADGSGWRVVKLNRVIAGDARKNERLVAATRNDVGRLLGQEYAQQFTTAARAAVGVKRNSGAIDQVRRDLIGGGPNN